jgi:hypothetical protein
MMSISAAVYEAGRELSSATPSAPIGDLVNRAILRFLGPQFKIDPGCAIDPDGKRSPSFASVVHHGPDVVAGDTQSFPADLVAAVIDVVEELNVENLRAAYGRIADAKTLRKTPVPKGEVRTNITLGVLFAARITTPMEIIAEELDRLNAQIPSHRWTDMIAIASVGTINYAVQFPGEGLSGDFLPPAEGAIGSHQPSPPVYLVMSLRPTGAHTFNRFLAFLIGHLEIFAPAAKWMNWAEVLDGVSTITMAFAGYQYNLKGDLVPVLREFYSDRYITPRPILIEDSAGKLLSTIQFLAWQDGGTIIVRGSLPLEMLLIFLGKPALLGGQNYTAA